MKKIFILGLLAAVLFTGCSAPKLVMNSKHKDGSRVMLTSDKNLFGNFNFALGAKIMPKGETVLGVLITCDIDSDHGLFDLNDKLLIRLTDSTKIELTNVYDKEYDKETKTETTTTPVVAPVGFSYAYRPFAPGIFVTPYDVAAFVPQTYVTTTTHSYALYLISKEQLESIIGKGVIKLRIEVENAEYNMGDTNYVGEKFSVLYDCLKDGIANPVKRTEF